MMRAGAGVALAALFGALGCEDKIIVSNAPDTPRASATATAAASLEPPPAPRPPIDESEFVESDLSRDPFRSYAKTFITQPGGIRPVDREVLGSEYSLDELKLVGIVTRMEPAKAMIVDPSGKGWVIKRGQFVGRADVVQGGGGTSTYEINWRVDRIRDGDVVFVREDPQNRDVPTITRIVPLRPEAESGPKRR
jgi:type IV pilus assembly protein PilP